MSGIVSTVSTDSAVSGLFTVNKTSTFGVKGKKWKSLFENALKKGGKKGLESLDCFSFIRLLYVIVTGLI